MPWEKRFDEDEALDAAMRLFWERGYQGVSMSDLVDELGVNRSSLYSTFGQKEDLFRLALLRYDRLHRQNWFAGLSERFDPLDSIRHTFAEVVEAPEPQRRYGCLLVNTTIDLPLERDGVAEVVQEAFDATERFFERQLGLAKKRGELMPETDCAVLASALMALFLGLRVLARAQRSSATISPIIRQVDSMLERELVGRSG